MKIKLSKSDWEAIGSKMGWIKSAQWSGRSDDYPDDESEGEEVSGVVDVDMTQMSLDEFPDVEFGGLYTISYVYKFPPDRYPDGDDSIEIKDIQVKEIHCEWVAEGKNCPDEAGLSLAKEKMRALLLDPRHGWDHEDQIREDARSDRPYEDPDAERKSRYPYED